MPGSLTLSPVTTTGVAHAGGAPREEAGRTTAAVVAVAARARAPPTATMRRRRVDARTRCSFGRQQWHGSPAGFPAHSLVSKKTNERSETCVSEKKEILLPTRCAPQSGRDVLVVDDGRWASTGR